MSLRSRFKLIFTVLAIWSITLLGCSPASTPNESSTEKTVTADGGTGVVTDGGTGTESQPTESQPTEPKPPQVTVRASGPEKAIDPGKRGPYTVGVTTLRLTDPSRKGADGKPRPMVIEVWYPAVDKAQSTPTDAYDMSKDAPDAVKAKMKSLKIQLPPMKQNAHRDAEPLRTEGPYPLILFSHGSGGIRFQSTFQTTHLASHGYVVVSADHYGNTLYDLFLDPDAQNLKNILKIAVERPKDVKFMLDLMKKRNKDQKDRFFKMVKFEHIGATGHSFGGMTSILVTKDIKEVNVIIPQAPHTSLIEALGVEPYNLREVTIMVMGAKDDRTLSYKGEAKGFYDRAITKNYQGADRYLVTLERGGHFSYSNICDLDLKKYAKRLGFGNVERTLNDGCATHNTPIKEAHRIINHYATALFNVTLRQSKVSQKYLKAMDGNKEVSYEHTPAQSK